MGTVNWRIWMSGIVAGTESAAYCGDLATAFGLTIDTVVPNFRLESLLDVTAGAGSAVDLDAAVDACHTGCVSGVLTIVMSFG